jgi:hypothetical protein
VVRKKVNLPKTSLGGSNKELKKKDTRSVWSNQKTRKKISQALSGARTGKTKMPLDLEV